MKKLHTRVRRLEARAGTRAPLPWEIPGWAQLSEAAQLLEAARYVAASPESALARQWYVLEACSDVELEALLATLQAQAGVAS